MKLALVTLAIVFTISTITYADNVRVGGSWDVSPHSDGDDRLSDGKLAMIGYERSLFLPTPWFRIDGGAWLSYFWHDTQKKKCHSSGSSVACVEPVPTRDCDEKNGDGYGLNMQAIVKPTLSLWIVDVWAAVGAGPDYQDTDGWELSYSYAYGLDIAIVGGISLSAWSQEVFRADGGEYRIPIAVGMKVGF